MVVNTTMNHPTPRSVLTFSLLLALPLTAITIASACSSGQAAERTPDRERGRYLVERVGLCADCHTPRDERGEHVLERWLAGAPIPFEPTVPMPFAEAAPPIHGLPTLPDDAAALTFLTTGVLPGGRLPRPPMPPYRFAPDDARDVLAYLRNPGQPTEDPTVVAARTSSFAR